MVGIRLVGGIANSGKSIFQVFDGQQTTPALINNIISALLVIFAFVVLALLFKRHKAFSVCYIVLESCFIVTNIITLYVYVMAPDIQAKMLFIASAAIPVIIGTLWIIYMLRSERVRKTFVFNWNEKPVQRLVDKANNIPVGLAQSE